MSSVEAKGLPRSENVPLSDYREFHPSAVLAASVECFWIGAVRQSSRTSSFHRVLPDEGMDLLFDFRAKGGQRASVIGAMTRPLTFITTGPVDVLGVRFRSGCLPAFLALDAAELTDARVDLTEFWGAWVEEVWDRLCEAKSADRVRLLQEALSVRANAQIPSDPFIRHCVARIEAARGGVRISDLEKSAGLSARQLERKFARHLGVSPKTFARIVRFRGVAAAAAKPATPDWVTLAGDFGFADQSHLAREFKTFSGLTPAGYLNVATDLPRNVGFLQDASAALG